MPIISDALCWLGLCGVSLAVVSSQLMVRNPQLVGTAVFLDLVLTASAGHWLLGVHWGRLPPWTLIPVASLGLIVSQVILPSSVVSQGILPLALAAVVEVLALLFVALRIRTVVGGYRSARRQGLDAFSAFQAGLQALGAYAAPVARWARLELELWFFACTGWFSRPRVPARAVAFSHHREGGWSAIALVLTLLVVIESVLMHLWLASAGFVTVQWLLLALHAYALIWILGDAHALRLRRTTLRSLPDGGVELDLCVGVRARARVPLSAIADARLGSWDVAQPGERLVRVAGPANVRIAFCQDVQLDRALGAPASMRVLLLQVDEPALLVRALVEQRPRRAGG
jgi:hypothetical protein